MTDTTTTLDILLNHNKTGEQTNSPVDILLNHNKKPISQDEIDANVTDLPNSLNNVEGYTLDPAKYKTIFQSEATDAINNFWKGIDQTDISIDDYSITEAELKIASNNKLLKQLNPLDPKYNELINENQKNQNKITNSQKSKESNLKEIQDEPVSLEYQLKEQLTQSQGSSANLWDKMKYTYPGMIGSSSSLIIPSIAAQFGTKMAATLATPVVGEVVAPFVALLSAAGAIAYGRHLETKGEVGSQIQQNKEALIKQYIDKTGKQPDQDTLDNIIIQANQGRDELYWENMAESIPDLAGAMMWMPELKLFGRVGEGLDKIKDYNKYTKIGTGVGKIALEYEKEKFEEGTQYAFQQRQQDLALGTGLYKNEGFIKDLLTDSEETLNSMNWSPLGEVRGNGRYAKDPNFQTSEESGGALAFIMGGFKGIYEIGKDLNTYRQVNKQLQEDGVFNTDDNYFKLKDKILQKHFEDETTHHLIEGVKSLVDKKDENGLPILTEEEARKEVNNIKQAYDIYNKVNSQVDNIEKKGFLRLFNSEEQSKIKKELKKT